MSRYRTNFGMASSPLRSKVEGTEPKTASSWADSANHWTITTTTAMTLKRTLVWWLLPVRPKKEQHSPSGVRDNVVRPLQYDVEEVEVLRQLQHGPTVVVEQIAAGAIEERHRDLKSWRSKIRKASSKLLKATTFYWCWRQQLLNSSISCQDKLCSERALW